MRYLLCSLDTVRASPVVLHQHNWLFKCSGTRNIDALTENLIKDERLNEKVTSGLAFL